MGHWTNRLVEMKACTEAVEWARQYPTPLRAWEACQHPEWMLWVVGKLAGSQNHQAIVLAAAACARTALKYVPAGEPRPLAAIEAAERWAKDPTEENRAAAGDAAGDAGDAGDAGAAARAAAGDAAGDAAEDAAWAAWAARAAAGAAWAARAAAGDAAEDAAGAAAWAAWAAGAAARAAAGDAAWDAAGAAAWAAWAARAAARAAAGDAAWDAAGAAMDAANREMAEIVRKFLGLRLLEGQYVLINKQ